MVNILKSNLIRIPLLVESARVAREVVFAKKMPGLDQYLVQSIPAFAYGVAYGDEVRLLDPDTGRFEVTKYGGQITLRIFCLGTLDTEIVKKLILTVSNLNGKHEIGKNIASQSKYSLLLVSLNVSIGFSAIESLLNPIVVAGDFWEYGNVYDQNGDPIGWWEK